MACFVSSSWELGHRGVPVGTTLDRLATALNTSTDYLLGRTKDPNPPDAKEFSVQDLKVALLEQGATQEDVQDIINLLEIRKKARELKTRLA